MFCENCGKEIKDKTDDCKFIRRVPKEELLIFDSEEAAIQNGRFINRCRECFSKDG